MEQTKTRSYAHQCPIQFRKSFVLDEQNYSYSREKQQHILPKVIFICSKNIFMLFLLIFFSRHKLQKNVTALKIFTFAHVVCNFVV